MSAATTEATPPPVQPTEAQQKIAALRQHLHTLVVGQNPLVESMLICLLCDGHMLIEGMPGLAKTTAAKHLARAIEGEFQRVQFTPDLLPADVIGTEIYRHESGSFTFRKGPVFSNILLADEINRAPAKVQSALLQAMEERQVTAGNTTYDLPALYMVLATQNPIEHEGTYPLPEAQLDRFFMHVQVDYPDAKTERAILEMHSLPAASPFAAPLLGAEDIFAARDALAHVHVSDALKEYIVALVTGTRQAKKLDPSLGALIQWGASPRATIALLKAARALAWLSAESFVTPSHVQAVAPNVLSHRIIPSFEAEAEHVSRRAIVGRLLKAVAIP